MLNPVFRYFDRVADVYDVVYSDCTSIRANINRRCRRALFQCLDSVINAHRWRDCSVLDVGCGPGVYLVELAQLGAHVTGVDASSAMVCHARQRIERSGLGGSIHVLHCDFGDQDFGTNFDVVLSIGVFEYTRSPLEHLKRMARCSQNVVIASFPAPGTIQGVIRKLRYKWHGIDLRFYEKQELIGLTASAGLVVRKLIPIGEPPEGFILVAQKAHLS